MIQVHLKKFVNDCIDQNPTLIQLVGHAKGADGRLGQIEGRLDKVEKRLDQVEKRLDQVEKRLDQVEKRLDQVEKRLDQVEKRLDKVEMRLEQIEIRLEKLESRMDRLEIELRELKEEFHRRGIMMEEMYDHIKIMAEGFSAIMARNVRNEGLEDIVRMLGHEVVTTKGVLSSHVQNSRIHLPN